MKKTVAFGITLVLVATLIGCGKKSEGSSGSSSSDDGNSREKIVHNFCAAFRSCSSGFLLDISFSMKSGIKVKNDLQPLIKMSKSKEPVKTKILRSYKDEEIDFSIVEAKCEDKDLDVDALYFSVGLGRNESEEDKILGMTADQDEVKKCIEKMKEREKEAGRTEKNRSDLESSRVETARLLIKNVELALMSYNLMHHGKYPDTLDALTQETEDEDALLQGDPVDPWGNELSYKKRWKKRPLIISAGPDGEFGTDDDITNYDERKSRESISRKVEGAIKAISAEEGTKAKSAVEDLDEGTIKRLGE